MPRSRPCNATKRGLSRFKAFIEMVKEKPLVTAEASKARIAAALEDVRNSVIEVATTANKLPDDERDHLLESLQKKIARYGSLKILHASRWNIDGTAKTSETSAVA